MKKIKFLNSRETSCATSSGALIDEPVQELQRQREKLHIYAADLLEQRLNFASVDMVTVY